MNLRQYSSVAHRRKALEEKRGVLLEHIGTFSLDESVASARNCENMIGVTQVPLGVAGPLIIKGQEKQYYLPLATTEGALVASVNRGCKAIRESGGAEVEIERIGPTRGPVFRVESLKQGEEFSRFLANRFGELQSIAASTSRHLTLCSYTLSGSGKYRYIRFVFDTQDAMGLNMVTIATTAIANYIEEQIGIRCIDISGNFCVDKKPSWQNFLNKRGIAVRAEVHIPSHVLTHTLKVCARRVYEAWLAKCLIGSAMSGTMGYNAQYANVIAALFIATGQDPAHVIEGSLGMTTTEIITQEDTEALYVSIYLPALMVGTVGGGTSLNTQKEALRLLGVEHSDNLAAVVGGAVLAGEISLLSSLAQGTLAQAHKRLGRGK
jgi:hydroxymethylglutaryl-CoA reductase (NADPH)